MRFDMLNNYTSKIISKWSLLLFSSLILTLSGCGESDKFYGDSGGTVTPGANYTLSAAATQSSIVVGSTTTINALLVDEDQQPVSGQNVTFYVDNGTFGGLQNTSAVTDGNGLATVTLTAAFQVGNGTVDVSYGDSSTSVNMTYTVGAISFLTLNAAPAAVGVSAESSLTVTALDQYGNAVTNRAMQFTVTTDGSNGASFFGPGIASTDSSGIATIIYTSGTTAPSQDVITVAELINPTVSATTTIDVTQSATTVGALTLALNSATTAITVGDTTITANATVVDTDGNAIPGVDVSFQISGTGDFSGSKAAVVATNANGLATAALTVPEVVGSATITASTGGKNATLNVTYIPDAPALVTVSASPSTVGVSTDSTVTATFFDQYGNETPNEPVTFSITADNSGGALLSNPTGLAQTNASGVASMVYTSGTTTVGVLDTVQVVATNGTQPSAAVDISVSQSATQITTLNLALSTPSSSITVGDNSVTADATVLDANGSAVPGVSVTFQIVGGGDFGGSKTVTLATNAQGVAQATLSAPDLVGSATITAASAGLSSTVNVTYLPDAPSAITLSATPASLGALSDSTLVATVFDQYGNVTPSEPVTFSFPTIVNPGDPGNYSGATLSNPIGTAQTDASGVATMAYTSGSITGVTDTIDVTAVNGTQPSTSTLISVTSASTVISNLSVGLSSPTPTITVGDNSISAIATISDSSGGPVANVPVSFEISGSGDFSGLKIVTVNTDATGVASAAITAPLLVGSATLTATASGLTSSVLVTYIAGAPASVALTGSATSVDVNSNVILSAEVRDTYGNLTPNEPVVYAIPVNISGATLSNPTGNSQTNTIGVAAITYTSGTLAGVTDSVDVTVTNGTSPTDTYSINVVSGASAVPTSMIIGTDVATISSDNSDAATITVTVLDSVNVVVPNVTVSFSSDGGVLSAGSVTTDANGQAVVRLSAGTDPTNQTIQVTASSSGVASVSVPVVVTGSTVTISPSRTNLILGGTDTATLTITAADSFGTGVYNETVSVSIDAGNSTGTATLTSASGTTDTLGKWTVDLTGVAAGTVRVVASALGATTTQDFTVEVLAGSLLITSPTSGDTAAINVNHTFSIDVPAIVNDITLASSLGTWSNAGAGVVSGGVVTWAGVAGTTVTADLSSSSIGTATIKVADTNNVAISDSIQLVFVDEVVDGTSAISLQASPSTVAPSTGDSLNSSALEATVVNALSQPIAGARVTFSIANSTGSGEYIDPPVAYTDASGVARANFYSGTQSTDSTGLIVAAALDETLTGAPAPSDSVTMLVNGTAGAIAIGTSTKVTSINDNTAYELPVTVQVTDSGGNPVANTAVNLSLWPQEYALGYWDCDILYRETILENEDADKDLILSTGEDLSDDGTLTPPISAAGAIADTVVTDENGLATTSLVYLKDYAGFIDDALTATTQVQGTETRATLRFTLPPAESDVDACLLGVSPLNAHWPTLTAEAEISTVYIGGGGTSIFVTLKDSNGVRMAGENVTAEVVAIGTETTAAPTLDGNNQPAPVTKVTDAFGQVTFAYEEGDKTTAASDRIRISYLTATNVLITTYVKISTTP